MDVLKKEVQAQVFLAAVHCICDQGLLVLEMHSAMLPRNDRGTRKGEGTVRQY